MATTSVGDGFSVLTPALAAAAETVTVVAMDILAAQVARPVARLAAVLPGSATGAAADSLAQRWGTASNAVAEAMARHAVNLADTAASYHGTDTVVAGELGAAG
jgi:uncharacterized protein YukE